MRGVIEKEGGKTTREEVRLDGQDTAVASVHATRAASHRAMRRHLGATVLRHRTASTRTGVVERVVQAVVADAPAGPGRRTRRGNIHMARAVNANHRCG